MTEPVDGIAEQCWTLVSICTLVEVGMPVIHLGDVRGHVKKAPQVCIIGAGFAGLLAGDRLARAGLKVVIVESGHGTSSPMLDPLNEIEDRSGRYQGANLGRARGLGGSSSRWSGGLKPIAASDMETRSGLSLAGWPFQPKELDRYDNEIESLFDVDSTPYEECLSETVDPKRYLPRVDPDFTSRWIKLVPRGKLNAAKALESTLKELPNLEVWTGATVCGFGLGREAGRLVRIEARGAGKSSLEVVADHFVIASGTIESTRLLLLLNRATDERAFSDCDALGHYFQDHLCATVGKLKVANCAATKRVFEHRSTNRTRRRLHLDLTECAQRDDGVASARVELRPSASKQASIRFIKAFARDFRRQLPRPTLQDVSLLAFDSIFLAKFGWAQYVRRGPLLTADSGLNVDICIEQLPSWKNRITLSDHLDPMGTPKAKLDWFPGEAEERTFRAVIRRLSAYWSRAGYDHICPIAWTETALDPEHSIQVAATDAFHPSGTTRMGIQRSSSVVDADLRCHHVPNVFIASASTFPTSGNANPTLTIMKVALRLADGILKQYRPAVAKRPDILAAEGKIGGLVQSAAQLPGSRVRLKGRALGAGNAGPSKIARG